MNTTMTLSNDPLDAVATSSVSDRVLLTTDSYEVLATVPQFSTYEIISDWNKLIEKRLLTWANNPEFWKDEEIVPPLDSIVNLAFSLAIRLRDDLCESPDRIVPDGDGGIAFEWIDEALDELSSLELHADGSTEFLHFSRSVLEYSRTFPNNFE